MDYFKEIPEEIITNIAKTLDQKTLCRLIMTSKDFKRICDTNDIWKYHYYLTIQNKWKITENSIHVSSSQWGPNMPQLYLYEFYDEESNVYEVKSYQKPSSNRISNMECPMMWDYRKNVKFIKCLGCEPYIPRMMGNSTNPLLFIKNGCLKCQADMISKENFIYPRPANMNYKEWEEDIKLKWKDFNESHGLHQLCQDPTHYDINTLDLPESSRGFSNYKKVIVKKLYTKIKNSKNVEKLQNDKRVSLNKVQVLKNRVYCEKEHIKSLDDKIKNEILKKKRIQDAIDSL